MSAHSITIENVTCLGCGCACDDIAVRVQDNRIVETKNACQLGARWLGDGAVPASSRVGHTDASVDEALDAAATLLVDASRPLVLLAPNLTCEAQRAGAAVADLLHARLDSITSATTLEALLAAQERGYASATLGEIRNRADVVVYWAINIASRYPRFDERYAPESATRTVVAVSIGAATSNVIATRRISVDPADELATLVALRALVQEPSPHDASTLPPGTAWRNAAALAIVLLGGRYIGLIFDAEPDERAPRSAQRFDALFALSHALNERTRCASIAMRAGGNRSGADSVLTSQTGYPIAVDFGRGAPRYAPHDGSALSALERRDVDATLVLGDVSLLPTSLTDHIGNARTILIGPRASNSALGRADVVIDTGIPGVHSPGTVVRADEVPLPLRPSIAGARSAEDIACALLDAVRTASRAAVSPR